MVQAGASGYALKDDTFTDLTRAIRAVVAGLTISAPGSASTAPCSDPPANPRSSPFVLKASERSQQELLPTTYFVKTAREDLRLTRWFRHQ